MFLGREPCNENFPSGSAIAPNGKNIEYSRKLAENFRLRNVGACLSFRKFYIQSIRPRPLSGHASKDRFKTRTSRDSANTTLTTNFFT